LSWAAMTRAASEWGGVSGVRRAGMTMRSSMALGWCLVLTVTQAEWSAGAFDPDLGPAIEPEQGRPRSPGHHPRADQSRGAQPWCPWRLPRRTRETPSRHRSAAHRLHPVDPETTDRTITTHKDAPGCRRATTRLVEALGHRWLTSTAIRAT
jgi:hypothetical protein